MPPDGGRTRTRTRTPFLFLAALGAGVAAIAALRRLDAVQVEGSSMAPALLPGDRVLAESWTYARRPPRAGETLLSPDPRGGRRELIKRVDAVRDGSLDLRGDLPTSSTDSRHFGGVPVAAVRWRVILRYWPAGRFGPVPPRRAPLELEPQGGEPACTAFEHLLVGAEEGR